MRTLGQLFVSSGETGPGSERPWHGQAIPRILQVASLSSLFFCATTKSAKEGASPPNALACNRDDDCVVLEANFQSECCDPCGQHPYVVSRAAADRMESVYQSRCKGVPCGELGCPRVGRPPSDFVAVCLQHACKIQLNTVRPDWWLPD